MADRLSLKPKQLKLLLFQEMFRRRRFHETILPAKKPFSAFGAELKKHGMVIKGATNGGQRRNLIPGDSQMRSVSFILAAVFLVAGVSLAGLSDNGLPGIGTFSYNGPPITAPAPMVVAAN